MTISILLADDHAVVRDGLRMILEAQKDISVVAEASDGRQAVAMAGEHQPAIALLDVTMPNLNGVEATHQIHDLAPSTKVIILSMHATIEHVFRALEAGAAAYVLKECAGRDVVHAVREVMADRKYLSEGITGLVVDDYVNRRGEINYSTPLSVLSPREREVLQLVVEGKSSKEIGHIISISSKTVDTYRSRLMHKLKVADVPQLVKFAVEHGLTPLN